jgi:hypothetical protein
MGMPLHADELVEATDGSASAPRRQAEKRAHENIAKFQKDGGPWIRSSLDNE